MHLNSPLRGPRRCALVASIGALLCGSPASGVAAIDLAPESLIGVEFPMAQPPAVSRDALRSSLLAGLRGLSGWPGDYEALKGHKAVAIEYEQPQGSVEDAWFAQGRAVFWGGAWEKSSEDEASQRALAQCQVEGRRCALFLVGDRMVLPAPLVEAHLAAWPRFHEGLMARLRAARKLVLLDHVAARQAVGGGASVAWPQPLLIAETPAGPPPEEAACGAWRLLLMTPVPVPDVVEWRRRLRQLAERGWLAAPQRVPPDNRRRVRFVQEFRVEPGRPVHAQLRLPDALRLAPQLRAIRRIWLEGEATLDQAGRVVRVAHEAAPVAIESAFGMYAGVWAHMADPAACRSTLP